MEKYICPIFPYWVGQHKMMVCASDVERSGQNKTGVVKREHAHASIGEHCEHGIISG